MNITTKKTCIRTIKKDDPKFYIMDGSIMSPRAGFEFSPSCPKEYKMIIQQALQYGYLKPVAIVKDNELFWDALG